MSLYAALPGSTPSGGSGTPGGAVGSVQFNLDGVNFGGFGNYDGTGPTLTLTGITIDDVTITNASVNGVTLDSTGAGNLVLSDDGTYISVAASDFIIDSVADVGVSTVLFQFPAAVIADAGIEWDAATNQLRIFNNTGSGDLNTNFRAIWEAPLVGYPAYHYPPGLGNVDIVAPGTLYFTNTGAPIVGLEMDALPNGINILGRFRSVTTTNEIAVSLQAQIITDSTGTYVRAHGSYGVL